ncbi:MAG: RNA pseudouridine synthase [Rhodoferax ferrireducens]|uniref:Dual-specificity RNA pseudouridine synthase RluA n=1 Tax=Rhodoferax ferrireducens TaxID=192843 RepID=A0A1W9KXV1_9BURK|nr:MAG: RNA pseudouridine synthase [Rhodoferax ferrireducens]
MPSTDQAGFSLVYEDEALLVLDKPAGLLSVPGRGDDKQDCLSSRVQKRYSNASIVHRLDMGTSGLLLMARGADMQRVLNNAFASRSVYKRYEAVVDGLRTLPATGADDDWQTIDLPIALDWPNRPRRIIDAGLGKPSQTRWQVMQVNPATHCSRLRLEPLTGRSHQLRVHLRAIGHPIWGDALYAPPAVAARSARLLLHATELALRHPVSMQPLRFVSPAPF